MKHINKKLTEQEVVEVEELLQKRILHGADNAPDRITTKELADRLNNPPKMVHRSTEKQR